LNDTRSCRHAVALAALVLALLAAQPAAAQDQATLVRVDPVARGAVGQTVPVIGRLVARQAGVVAARINGAVEAFRVEVGDRVEQGQVIATLQTESLAARRDLEAGELAEAEALVITVKARRDLARQTLDRLEGLKKSAAFSQARYEDALQEVVIAEAQGREARAAVESAKAELRMAEINLYNAEIRAPYAGVVAQRLAEAGAYLQVGASVARIIGDRELEVEADVPFQRLAGLEPGTEVRFTLDDQSEHTAVVRAVIPEENPLTRTRAVRFVPSFGETRRPVAVDQSATLHVPTDLRQQVLTVHKDAVIKQQGGDIVFVVAEGAAEARPVRLGEAVGSRFEVLDGLAEGEPVVIRGNERLRPGQPVRVDQAS